MIDSRPRLLSCQYFSEKESRSIVAFSGTDFSHTKKTQNETDLNAVMVEQQKVSINE